MTKFISVLFITLTKKNNPILIESFFRKILYHIIYKYTGYRIELGEIESKISAIDGIILCCSIYDEKEDKIILYYQTNSLEEDKLISLIREKLPTYMVPNVYIKLDRMPYNANGKIDRKELKNKYLSK